MTKTAHAPARRGIEGVAAQMRERHVSPAIIERVVRLNRPYAEGQNLRGIHYTTHRDAGPYWQFGAVRKGEFIRKHGRQAFESMPREFVIRRGRRAYLKREAVEDQVWMRA